MFSRLHAHFVRFLMGEIDAREAYRLIDAIEKQRTETPLIAGRETFFANLEFILAKKLYEISSEFSADQANVWSQRFLDNDGMRNRGHELEPHQRLSKYQVDARRAFAAEDWLEAAKNYALYLETDERFIVEHQVNSDEDTAYFANTYAEEIAWDYRNAGRAFLNAGLPNSKELASKVWNRGLAFTDNRGKMIFSKEMRESLKAL